MTRRDLIQFPMLFAGMPALCCDTPDVPAAAIRYEPGTLCIDLRLAPDLHRPGAGAKLVDPARKLNLIVTHPGRRHFVVLDRPCTHGGGPVAFSQRRHTVQCTCWGRSEFALDGKVVAGPAKRPLRVYDVRLNGTRLEVRFA